MDSRRQHRTDAELAITKELESFQNRAASMWHGMEKAATIELVRSLDAAAVARFWTPQEESASHQESGHFYVGVGAASALRPFLSAIKGMPGGVPWGRSSEDAALFADSYLTCCGKLAHLRRMAALEHYGLASTSMTAPDKVVIETRWSGPELAAMAALRAWRARGSADRADSQSPQEQREDLWRRMRSYVESDPQYLIRYDNDLEIVASYRADARIYGRRYFEGEAFPSDVQIGGRSFGEWKESCDQALGRILCHMDFARLLQEKRSRKVALRDVLTIFARREDMAAVWQEAGLRQARVEPTMAALSLGIDDLDDWERAYETPTPFYVDLGRDFVLLPCFGALGNPYFALFRHLRATHKADWDRGVDRREDIFRSDLRSLFRAPRFLVPLHGFTLRRPDGSSLTDVDAAVLDRDTGTLALIQLKWHDVFGRSLAERESRRRNIGEANEWVGRVHSWVGERSSAEVLRALGAQEAGSARPPVLYVVARYITGFSGETRQDPRAAWLGWPEMLDAMGSCEGGDPLAHLPETAAARRARFTGLGDIHEEFRFPGLAIELRVSSSF